LSRDFPHIHTGSNSQGPLVGAEKPWPELVKTFYHQLLGAFSLADEPERLHLRN